jgi:hypothetical protein
MSRSTRTAGQYRFAKIDCDQAVRINRSPSKWLRKADLSLPAVDPIRNKEQRLARARMTLR